MSDYNPRPYWLPIVLLGSAFVLWFGFQTVQLVAEGRNLAALTAGQESIYANAQRMRGQLDALAAGVARLAARDNDNAIALVKALKERGITINAQAAAPSDPPKQQ